MESLVAFGCLFIPRAVLRFNQHRDANVAAYPGLGGLHPCLKESITHIRTVQQNCIRSPKLMVASEVFRSKGHYR